MSKFTPDYVLNQGRSQRGAGGGAAPPDKVLAPLVGPGRYIQSVQNNKFFNQSILVQLKNSLASGSKAPGFFYIYIYIYIYI